MKYIFKKPAAAYRRVKHLCTKWVCKIKLRNLITDGFPSFMREPVLFLTGWKPDAAVSMWITRIERIRADIAAQGQQKVGIMYSPPPISSGEKDTHNMRPTPGKTVLFTMEQIAHLGKDDKWGAFLHLCAKSIHAQVILEMGACAGISGCYLASSPFCRQFITIEGSSALAKLAERNLSAISSNAVVHHALFDAGLDRIFCELQDPIDFAFIDGHHEQQATIHYFQRLQLKLNTPSMVVFDDISWSSNMRDAWRIIAASAGFTHAIDLGNVGVCIWDGITERPRYWDLQPLVGHVPIGDSGVGWAKTAGVTLDGFPGLL
jgi:predicted O-methyltransferase YrrM